MTPLITLDNLIDHTFVLGDAVLTCPQCAPVSSSIELTMKIGEKNHSIFIYENVSQVLYCFRYIRIRNWVILLLFVLWFDHNLTTGHPKICRILLMYF